MKDYNELVRNSIKKDFANANFKKKKIERNNGPQRIVAIADSSTYANFRRLLLGRLVRVIKSGYSCGYWVEFVREKDREALNAAAGWSEDKRQFLLDGITFKNNTK